MTEYQTEYQTADRQRMLLSGSVVAVGQAVAYNAPSRRASGAANVNLDRP